MMRFYITTLEFFVSEIVYNVYLTQHIFHNYLLKIQLLPIAHFAVEVWLKKRETVLFNPSFVEERILISIYTLFDILVSPKFAPVKIDYK